MSLSQMPVELTVLILERYTKRQESEEITVEHEVNIKHLANFSRVNRTWHLIVEPALYRTFIRNPNRIRSASQENAGMQPSGRLRSFLRTLIQRPYLARHVKQLAIGYWGEPSLYDLDDVPYRAERPDAHLRSLYNKAVTLIQTETENQLPGIQLIIRLRTGDDFAEICLLLHLVSNVEELYLPVLPELPKLFEPLFRSAQSGSSLHYLKKIVMRHNLGTPSLIAGFGAIHQLLQLASLEQFEIHNCQISVFRPEDYRKSPYRIQRLCVKDCFVQDRTLAMLLEDCSGLRSFEYTYAQRIELQGSTARGPHGLWSARPMVRPYLFQGLATQGATLESLTLKGKHMWGFNSPPFAVPGVRLAFRTLKHLDVQQAALLGSDWFATSRLLGFTHGLPNSLVNLSVSHCSIAILRELSVAIPGIRMGCPSLVTITLAHWDLNVRVAPNEWPEMFQLLHDVEVKCAAEGIKFEKGCFVR